MALRSSIECPNVGGAGIRRCQPRDPVRTVGHAGDHRWDHTNLRANRSEAFSMLLREGAHRFSYTARAITPGTFMAAPAKAEEMYSPETFGRSTSEVVVVE
ncbi:MAG: hypothetical protein AB7P03_02250 [Kofleriaceae bacterium]